VCDQCIADRDSKGDGMSAMILKSLVFENIDGRQIKLSEEEARQLYRELDTLFRDKSPICFQPAPIVIERNPTYPVITWTGPNTCRWDTGNGWLAIGQCEEATDNS